MTDFQKKVSFNSVGRSSAKTQENTFSPACIFIDEVETQFLESHKLQPFFWLCFIDNIFFTWTYGGGKNLSVSQRT